MANEQTEIVNEHLRQNASADTADEIRRRKRMAELQAERDKNRQERRPDFQPSQAPTQQTK